MSFETKAIQNLLDGITEKHSGIKVSDAIPANFCCWCALPVTGFDDELSRREYSISGLCQKCQDKVFGEPDES